MSSLNDGMMSAHLVLPVNHFLRTFSAERAQRALRFVMALAEVGLFALVFRIPFL
jgi:hypothetical protein